MKERITDPTKFPIKEKNFDLEKPKWYILNKDKDGNEIVKVGEKPLERVDDSIKKFNFRAFALSIFTSQCVKYPFIGAFGLSTIITGATAYVLRYRKPNLPNIFYFSFLGFFSTGAYICDKIIK